MKRKQLWVMVLVVASLGSAAAFAWLLGVFSLSRGGLRVEVLYHFAGGVEVGSPVRVSGVKVGQVERIDFLEPKERDLLPKETHPPALKLTLTVAQRAVGTLRDDSRFYVNMAGIIGERYVEISPGTESGRPLVSGAVVRGIDPPRIDQLLSQGYNVFGKIQEFLEKNEKPLQEIVESLQNAVDEFHKALKGNEKKKIWVLIDNLATVTSDVRAISHHLNDPRTRDFFERLNRLTERADTIDKATLKKFLQEEGIRARIF